MLALVDFRVHYNLWFTQLLSGFIQVFASYFIFTAGPGVGFRGRRLFGCSRRRHGERGCGPLIPCCGFSADSARVFIRWCEIIFSEMKSGTVNRVGDCLDKVLIAI